MSTILIDRRTAALLGELATAPGDRRVAVHVGERRDGRRDAFSRALEVVVPPHSALPARVGRALPGPLAVGDAPATRPSRMGPPRGSGSVAQVTQRGVRVALRRPAADPRVRVERRSGLGSARAARTADRSGRGPGLHLTRRGRLTVLLLFLVVLTVAFGVGRVTSTALGDPSAPGREVVVQQGETLWSIAERVAPDADPRATVGELMAVNGLASPSLDAGQHLRLP